MSGGITEVDVPHGHSEHGIGFAAGSPSFSSSGRYLAFASEDPEISSEDRNSSTTPAGDTFPVRDIFVYDRSTGRVSLVSRANGAKGGGGNQDSNLPSISADGNYVAFQTEATNFLHGSYGGIFVRDLRRHTTRPAASLRLHPGGALNGGFTPSISAHGRWVAFLTSAHFHHGNALEVAVRDMNGKRAVYASRADGRHGALAAGDCKLPVISANGRYVAFASKAKNLSRNRQGQRRRRLRPRPEDEPHAARLTRAGQARRGGEWRLLQPLDLRRRPLRRLRILREQSRPGRQQHESGHLRPRHAQRPRLPRLARHQWRPGGKRALGQPVDLERRPLRRLRLARLESEPRRHAARDQRLPLPAAPLTV